MWVHSNGDVIRVFSTRDKANEWFAKHDPEGVAFEYNIDDDAAPPAWIGLLLRVARGRAPRCATTHGSRYISFA